MKEIQLTKGYTTQVDDEDYSYLNLHKWYADIKGNYIRAVRSVRDGTKIYMHNQILQIKGIDHQDGNALNNQRYNLRLATQQQNMMNRRKMYKKCTSQYKGVAWHKKGNSWEAYIWINLKKIYLGLYKSEQEAALTYNNKAIELFGEYARLNDVEGETNI